MTCEISDFTKVKALVIGDAMLDRYVRGCASRISPEAPVPVFRAENVTDSPGGAANVAMNIAALGCRVKLLGAAGDDIKGAILADRLSRAGIKHDLTIASADVTTCKTRYVVGDKHLLRMDQDSDVRWSDSNLKRFLKKISQELKKADVAILSDYEKGVLTEAVCRAVISEAKKTDVPVMVDPKGRDYSKYAGATLLKPNFKEFVEVSGCKADFRSSDWKGEISRVAARLGKRLRVGALLVTLGERGMLYVPSGNQRRALHFAAEAKEVFDVSGAGDTSMAVFAAAIAAKAPVSEAARLANTASAIAVAKSGTSVVSAAELQNAVGMPSRRKVVSLDECVRIIGMLRSKGKTIGFTNGCFDCCHLGHIKSMQRAKALCDVLVVGINSDRWIMKHKGKDRPIQNESTRVGVVAALECVDYVIVFSSETALPLVRKIRPQVIAKEGYTLGNWPEGAFVESIGGKAVVLEHVKGCSTTATILRMRRRTGE